MWDDSDTTWLKGLIARCFLVGVMFGVVFNLAVTWGLRCIEIEYDEMIVM